MAQASKRCRHVVADGRKRAALSEDIMIRQFRCTPAQVDALKNGALMTWIPVRERWNTAPDGDTWAGFFGLPGYEFHAGLDWDSAWVDGGPSPAGNLGPYLKVPYPPEDTVHRVYSRIFVGDTLFVGPTRARSVLKIPYVSSVKCFRLPEPFGWSYVYEHSKAEPIGQPVD
jgi:hypothetical protein